MRPAKLFHAIVVAGAALGACGDDDDRGDTVVADAGLDGGASDLGRAVDAAMAADLGPDEEDAFVAIL